MTAGLEIFDSGGKLICDTDTLSTYSIGTIHIDSMTNGNTPADSRLANHNKWIIVLSYDKQPVGNDSDMSVPAASYLMPAFNLSYANNYISWTWRDVTDSNSFAKYLVCHSGFTIMYGVY